MCTARRAGLRDSIGLIHNLQRLAQVRPRAAVRSARNRRGDPPRVQASSQPRSQPPEHGAMLPAQPALSLPQQLWHSVFTTPQYIYGVRSAGFILGCFAASGASLFALNLLGTAILDPLLPPGHSGSIPPELELFDLRSVSRREHRRSPEPEAAATGHGLGSITTGKQPDGKRSEDSLLRGGESSVLDRWPMLWW
jgi:hypothetical protein